MFSTECAPPSMSVQDKHWFEQPFFLFLTMLLLTDRLVSICCKIRNPFITLLYDSWQILHLKLNTVLLLIYKLDFIIHLFNWLLLIFKTLLGFSEPAFVFLIPHVYYVYYLLCWTDLVPKSNSPFGSLSFQSAVRDWNDFQNTLGLDTYFTNSM